MTGELKAIHIALPDMRRVASKILDRSVLTYGERPRQESNLDLQFRKPSFYPLNYGDKSAGG